MKILASVLRCRKAKVKRFVQCLIAVGLLMLVVHLLGIDESYLGAVHSGDRQAARRRAWQVRNAAGAAAGQKSQTDRPDSQLPWEESFYRASDSKIENPGPVGVVHHQSDEDQRKIVKPIFQMPGVQPVGIARVQVGDEIQLHAHPVDSGLPGGVAPKGPNSAVTSSESKTQPPMDSIRSMSAGSSAAVEPTALLILRATPFFSISLADIRELLTKHRIRFDVGRSSARYKSFFPQSTVTLSKQGRYSVVILEDWALYTEAAPAKKKELEAYCKKYGVGMVAFVSPAQPFVFKQVTARPLMVKGDDPSVTVWVQGDSPILRIVKDGGELSSHSSPDWCAFEGNLSPYLPVERAKMHGSSVPRIVSLYDSGEVDGVQRVMFCRPAELYLWLHKALFLDAVVHMSPVKIGYPLKRRFLVDIDDVFVAPMGTKMSPGDVEELIHTQEEVRKTVPDFTYNLGFVGAKYRNGTKWESEGDAHFVKNANHFYWFPHTYTHFAPHRIPNITDMLSSMWKNKNFSMLHNLPVSGKYAVSPKHSGVYPVHEHLYTGWRDVWGVTATSTEEYMHLKPGYKRRGFVYRGVKVLPRQTCGLFTHTFKKSDYPGGFQRLQNIVEGGGMFESVLHNPISIFMTHVSNFGHDRLGNYVTKAVVEYLTRWTNLELSYAPPHEVATEYFDQYPEETMPLWLDPCRDPRHYAIWSEEERRCYNLPNALIVGPQKTGTTALLNFMTMHPNISRNRDTVRHFEEMQFFSNDVNYLFGLDWYMSHMPLVHAEKSVNVTYNVSSLIERPSHFIIEKSATYFDSYLTPLRAWRLLPSMKVIVILVDPAKRAYSWWQHEASHKHPTTQQIQFRTLLNRNHKHSKVRTALKSRCLYPGHYAQHLRRWMSFIPSSQIHIVDGEKLVSDPVPVMHHVQKFLNVSFVDYGSLIKKSEKKGFYCPVVRGKLQCLGRGKGRVYPPMDKSARRYLGTYYRSHNEQLASILKSMKVQFPAWLAAEMNK